ncbi:hypothetical protein RvY_01742 [Ramazzottius varieornatus]|uniref:Uncharacterized protein n=1 Tax=Ramazzottius varieornatus TaxID=947166 RepID=A0A1D1USJ4_RAMVA|nr:hypothetical protein RvY_01742 [Ramazzottius varieornatus]
MPCPRKTERRTMIVCGTCNVHVFTAHRLTKQSVVCLDCSKKKSK